MRHIGFILMMVQFLTRYMRIRLKNQRFFNREFMPEAKISQVVRKA